MRPYVLAAAIGVVLCLAGCGTGRPKNVILISLDTLRADHVGSYGYQRDTTPFLDKIAAEGVRFSHAFVNTLPTQPSHSTLFTSLFQEEHGIAYRPEVLAIPDEVLTLAEILQNNGYFTVGVTEGGYVSKKFGFGQGFDLYLDDSTNLETTIEQAVSVLRGADPARPVFLFFHTYEVHTPYRPPASYRKQFGLKESSFDGSSENVLRFHHDASGLSPQSLEDAIGLYDAEIRYVDDQLRALFTKLDELGVLRNVAVVITADHGEEFADHGGMSHRLLLYDELVRVPLLFWGTAIERGRVDDRMAGSVDILPSILSMAGIPPPDSVRGVDLTKEAPPGTSEAVLLQANARMQGVRTRAWKLIEANGETLLFNLLADPREQKNVAAEQPHIVEELRAELRALRRNLKPLAMAPKPSLNAAQLERLRSLGYLQGDVQPPPPKTGASKLIGSVDRGCKFDSPVRGPVELAGWAVDSVKGAPVHKVVITVSGVSVGEVGFFLPRPDVAKAYGRDDYLESGWIRTVDFSAWEPGEYVLEARIVGTEGQVSSISPCSFHIGG